MVRRCVAQYQSSYSILKRVRTEIAKCGGVGRREAMHVLADTQLRSKKANHKCAAADSMRKKAVMSIAILSSLADKTFRLGHS